jgi:hypothetical protein
MARTPIFNPWTRTLQWISDVVGSVAWSAITGMPAAISGTQEAFTTTLKNKIDGITNPLLFKGAIAVATDFPTLATVQNGWTYTITADVTDNNATRTNTGISFLQNAEIAWNGSTWVQFGYSGVKSVNGETGVVSIDKTDVGLGNVDNKSEATIITDVKADIDVASAISLKHTQGTDQGLDTGGANEVSAANAKTGYTHSQIVTGNPHNTNIDDLGDVDASAPSVDDVLAWNGSTYVNRPGAQVTIGLNTTFFLDDTPSSTGGQQTLLKTPDTATLTETDSVVVNNNTLAIEHYLYDTALGGTEIEAGIWEFNFWSFVSSTAGNTSLIYIPYKVVSKTGTVAITGTGTSRTATVSGATPFVAGDANANILNNSCLQTPNGTFHITAFTSNSVVTMDTPNAYVNESGVAYSIQYKLFQVSSNEIDNTVIALNSVTSVQPSFVITATDKLSLGVYATTDAVANRTVSYTHNGTTTYSHFHAPLGIRHNDLAGLNVGNYVHLTAAEKSRLDGMATGAIANVVEDTTPELGGELNCGLHSIGFSEQAITSSSNVATIDWKLSNKAKITLSENITTLNFTAPTKPCNLLIKVIQDATPRTIAWPAAVKWNGGAPPTLTATSGARDIIGIYFDGTYYYSSATQNFVVS